MFKSFFSRKKPELSTTNSYLNQEHKLLAVIRENRNTSLHESDLYNNYFNGAENIAQNILIDYRKLGYVSEDSSLHLTKAGLYHLEILNRAKQKENADDLKFRKTTRISYIAIIISILSFISSTAISLTALLI